MSDAWDGVKHAFQKAGSVIGLTDDPDNPSSGPELNLKQMESAHALTYDQQSLKQPDVTPDDSTLLLAQGYAMEDDHLRRSQAIQKPKQVDKDISPETLMIAGGVLAAAVLLSE